MFSVLDNRHLADIYAICQKCQFYVKKGLESPEEEEEEGYSFKKGIALKARVLSVFASAFKYFKYSKVLKDRKHQN